MRVLRKSGEAALERGTQNCRGYVYVITIEEHSDGDKRQDAAMKRGDGKAIEARAGIDAHEGFTFSCRGRPGCPQ